MAGILTCPLHQGRCGYGKPVIVPPPSSFILGFAFRDMVEELFIGQLLTIAYCTKMFNLDPPSPLDDLISFSLKLYHRRKISGDGVSSPYFCVNDPVEGPAQFFDGSQTRQAVFAVAEG